MHVAKGKTHKLSVMREASNLRAAYRKWLIRLIVGVTICLVAIFVYYLLVINYVIENQPGLTWILAAIAAVFLGIFGNKFSKSHRIYDNYITDRGITDGEVKEFIRENG